MLDCNIFPGLSRDYLETEVNLFLLPLMENDGEDALTRAGQKTVVKNISEGKHYQMKFGLLNE